MSEREAERAAIVAMLEEDAALLKAMRDEADIHTSEWWEMNAQWFATLRAMGRVKRGDHDAEGAKVGT